MKYLVLPLAAASAAALMFAWSRTALIEPGLQAAKTGVVLDAETQQPLAGAYVVARWLAQSSESALFGNGTNIEGRCLYRVITQTDAQGHYTIPATTTQFGIAHDWLPDRRTQYSWSLHAYAPGRSTHAVNAAHPQAGEEHSSEPLQTLAAIALGRDADSADRRVSGLIDALGQFACHPYAQDPAPVEQAIFEEAYAIACEQVPDAAAHTLARLQSSRVQKSAAPLACAASRQANNGPAPSLHAPE